ncbi:metal-dependent transcriptional regulator [Erysipelothrix sp. HDW6C]|uniref:metal-dependent transcriptional regulator n=1 Tax=Erysipelothrix sp. HDW6C TaxID=2714930 RepID=UPI0014076F6C|nr:metal-dependent transcriptional regulator [Erysipelothrix sp. HDW6C]QIK69150.1 metal-dependent transcriptional regulator [Erysipelothrix sp. HDW6C]
MTPNREDYIKIIFSTNERGVKLSNKELAERLGVSAASTSEMIRKLMDSKHVVKDKELGLALTEKGTKEAQALVRKHRLWEVFLVEHLNYSWTEVHDDAEILEHGTSDLLADRLSTFLGNPKYCPHGSIIYGNAVKDDTKTSALANLAVGESGTIMSVRDSVELLRYLETIKLSLGDSFELIRVDPYEGPFHVRIGSDEVVISYKAAHDIEVVKQ